jgi:musculin (activated B-cell factor-1)
VLRMGRRKACDEVFEEGEKVPRNAANERERTRMRVLSKAFGRLKLTLPWVPPDTKLSKLDTLRLAMSYIGHLQKTVEEDDSNKAENKAIAVPIKNKVGYSNLF